VKLHGVFADEGWTEKLIIRFIGVIRGALAYISLRFNYKKFNVQVILSYVHAKGYCKFLSHMRK